MHCDARYQCYEQPGIVGKGSCEGFISLYFNFYNQNLSQIPNQRMQQILYFCLKEQEDRKKCDNKSQYWPLPKVFNHGNGDGN